MCVSQYLTELWIFEQNYAHWAHCTSSVLQYSRRFQGQFNCLCNLGGEMQFCVPLMEYAFLLLRRTNELMCLGTLLPEASKL